MSDPRLPPELFDHIVDYLHDQPEALKRCCLVSKSWIPCARKHLFREVAFRRHSKFNAWKNTFPNPANSPGYYTRSLVFQSTNPFVKMVTEDSSCFRAFRNVVQLMLWCGSRDLKFVHFHLLTGS